jgi:hypothetical protein
MRCEAAGVAGAAFAIPRRSRRREKNIIKIAHGDDDVARGC